MRSSQAKIVTMGGAKAAPSIVDAQLLWDFTVADVVVVLDGLAADEILPIWRRVQDLARKGRTEDALRELTALKAIVDDALRLTL